MGFYLFYPFHKFKSLPDEGLYIVKVIFYVLLFIGYWAFTGVSLYRNFSDGLVLLVIGVVVLVMRLWDFGMAKKHLFGISCKSDGILKNSRIWNWILGSAFIIFFIIYTFWTAFGGQTKNPSNLIGIAGIVFYILISLFCSIAPHRVKWRPVVWGFALQVHRLVLLLLFTKKLVYLCCIGFAHSCGIRCIWLYWQKNFRLHILCCRRDKICIWNRNNRKFRFWRLTHYHLFFDVYLNALLFGLYAVCD